MPERNLWSEKMDWKILGVLAVLFSVGAGVVFAHGMAGKGNLVQMNADGFQDMMDSMDDINLDDMLSMHNNMHGTSLTKEEFAAMHQNTGSMSNMHNKMHGGNGSGDMNGCPMYG